jgi:hypothetical protein
VKFSIFKFQHQPLLTSNQKLQLLGTSVNSLCAGLRLVRPSKSHLNFKAARGLASREDQPLFVGSNSALFARKTSVGVINAEGSKAN